MVVVVFPSLPVTPIILQGHKFISISISEVIKAPLFCSETSCKVVGKQLGDLKITLNPLKKCNAFLPTTKSKLYSLILATTSGSKASISLSSKTVTFAIRL